MQLVRKSTVRGSGDHHNRGWPSGTRETAVAVGSQESLGPQVAASGKQAVGFAQSRFEGRKAEVVAL